MVPGCDRYRDSGVPVIHDQTSNLVSSSFLFLVEMPGAASSFLLLDSDALCS